MCEIAVLDTSRFSTQELVNYAMELYRTNQTALGIVAVYENDGSFKYEELKSFEPDVEDVKTFLAAFDDSIWTIIHARLATHGKEKSLTATHPIHTDCNECTIDSIIHNGVFTDYKIRGDSINEGHEYKTRVDTETIAHLFSDVPETIDEAEETLEKYPGIARQYGFILLGESRIYFYGNRYEINEAGEMYHRQRPFANESTENDYQQMIVTAGGEK